MEVVRVETELVSEERREIDEGELRIRETIDREEERLRSIKGRDSCCTWGLIGGAFLKRSRWLIVRFSTRIGFSSLICISRAFSLAGVSSDPDAR